MLIGELLVTSVIAQGCNVLKFSTLTRGEWGATIFFKSMCIVFSKEASGVGVKFYISLLRHKLNPDLELRGSPFLFLAFFPFSLLQFLNGQFYAFLHFFHGWGNCLGEI